MQTNRDDFIIAIRSAFLKKGNQQRFSLIALIFFSIFIIVLGKYNFKGINFLKLSLKELVYRTTFIVSVPENFVISSYQKIRDHFYLYSSYENLKKDYESLKATKLNTDFLKSENEALKSKINDVSTQSSELLAKVIIDKKSPFLRSVIVNRGSKDNVILGMAVLDEKFLVGKVVEVNYSTSRVLLLSDLNSKIPVSIEPNGVQSILSGSGFSFGEIQYIKENYELENDSEIFTSGSGGIFRSGIPIGKTIADENIGFDTIKVKFHSDFSQLRLDKIVSFKEVKQND
jgi:rod shape-determining protein MreC